MDTSQPETHLTALDAAFLAFEGDRTPAHVGSVCFFDGAPFHDADGRFRIAELRRRIEARLHLVPRLRQIPLSGPLALTRPTLVDDPAFDIAHHVKVLEAGAPGDDASVLSLAATLHMELLDRSRPLWELWFVDGLADGRVALIEKIHHAIVDGVSGVEVATVLLDLQPDVEAADPTPWTPAPLPRPVGRLAAEISQSLRPPVDAVTAAIGRLLHPVSSATDLASDLLDIRDGLSQPKRAPESPLNQEVGHRRELTVVRRPLEAVRDSAHAHDATVNDLVLSAVGGGLRRWLRARGDLPDDPAFELRALIPVSMHTSDGEIGNQVGSLFVPIPVGIDDPVARLQSIASDLAERKAGGAARSSAMLLHAVDLLPAAITRTMSLAVHHQGLVNLVITNVPGPPFALYAMGAEMLDAVPVVPLAGNLGLSVGVLSYNGSLNIGLFADPDVVPDLDVLRDGIDAEFDLV
ncbi:wax ester/triacylglycerol synthase family O-acyltransferase [Actinospongicola halichondriae]|uniref:wax ester/triacylglycerol synthase family O-acyltransferase n=1 Tax=Actinospongicola halichondriae TaxID=3236844 RepID=UPI003D429438